MWITLIVLTITMLALALRVEYVEDIISFFPKNTQSKDIFNNLKAKDRIAIMLSCENNDEDSQYQLMDLVDTLDLIFNNDAKFAAAATFSKGVDPQQIDLVSQFIYNHLPLFLEEADYQRLENITNKDSLATIMESNYQRLISPIGSYITDYIYSDPLSLASKPLKHLENLGENFNYTIIEDYVFSKDGKTTISYIDIKNDITAADKKYVVKTIEDTDIPFQAYGAPLVAEANAHQIKIDSILTLNIALLFVIILLSIAFRNKYSIFYVILPVVFGALFSLAIISLVKGSISLISVGAGSIIFGIALSYSIHYLSHTIHSNNPEEIISDLAYPLTVGSFTTIGAFIGLMFTSSPILNDLGLFASLALIGTVCFVLIFLPHFVQIKDKNIAQGHILTYINKALNLSKRTSRIISAFILILLIIGIRFASDVKFDSDMMNLNYETPKLKAANKQLMKFNSQDKDNSSQIFISSSEAENDAIDGYKKMCRILDSISQYKTLSYSSINQFLLTKEQRNKRIQRWNGYWTKEKVAELTQYIDSNALLLGFESGAFKSFTNKISSPYTDSLYTSDIATTFSDWANKDNSSFSYTAQVKIPNKEKADIYNTIAQDNRLLVADRSFFTNSMASDAHHNFVLALYISSILVFLAMLICYGRIELTLMAFAPMFISWIIILGLMAILGIQFNLVTIILSTFIFGIGDDFSIFMLDGLQSKYKNGKDLLSHHKVAIFFSAFAVIVGMGALVFAKHPAMNSLGTISLLGILIVVLVSFTIQPWLFRFFISLPTEKGDFPFTLLSLLNTIYCFGLFTIGCIIIQILILISYLLPLRKAQKQTFIHYCVYYFCRGFFAVMLTVKVKYINEYKEQFQKSSVIIANHQSFIDILLVLSMSPKIIMVTKDWVWQSPIFGRIVRYLGFFNTGVGYEKLIDTLQEKVNMGYSIVIFPEGTRSSDREIKRFHKGAFYLAEELNLDILPLLLYGAGLASSKTQGLYIKYSILVMKLLQRISPTQTEYGVGYRDRNKAISLHFKNEYAALYEEYNRTSNIYFKDAIIKNYIFKGPVLEWYMKVKLRLEKWYEQYDRLVPRKGIIVDIGCGYGAMSYMLSILSNRRTIYGIDYDQEKIEVAKNAFLANDKLTFSCADIRQVDFPVADAFIISDVLHYLNYQEQEAVIAKCIANLSDGGSIIIKDGDSSLEDRHKKTEDSEKWSTQIIKFNKTDGELHFLSHQMIERLAQKYRLDLKTIDSNSRLSNIIYVLTKSVYEK